MIDSEFVVEIWRYWLMSSMVLRILWIMCAFFLLLFFVFLLFLLSSRVYKNVRDKRRKSWNKRLEPLLAEALFSDKFDLSVRDRNDNLYKLHFESFLKSKMAKLILYQELIKMHKNYKGELAARIETLFFLLGFEEVCLDKVKDKSWYIRAEGIYEGSEMGVKRVRKFAEANLQDENNSVRIASLVCLIKLEPKEPLSFFASLKYELSHWDMIQLYDTLSKIVLKDPPDFSPYCSYKSVSTREFALKLIGQFKQIDSSSAAESCLCDPELSVRIEAVRAIISLDTAKSPQVLYSFIKGGNVDQDLTVEVINYLELRGFSEFDDSFIESTLRYENKVVYTRVLQWVFSTNRGKEFLSQLTEKKRVELISLLKSILGSRLFWG